MNPAGFGIREQHNAGTEQNRKQAAHGTLGEQLYRHPAADIYRAGTYQVEAGSNRRGTTCRTDDVEQQDAEQRKTAKHIK